MVAWFRLGAAVRIPACVAALVVVRLSIVGPVLPIRACQRGAAHPPKGMGDSASQRLGAGQKRKKRGEPTNNSA